MANATKDTEKIGDDEGWNPVLARNFIARMNGRSIEKIRTDMAEAGIPVGTGAIAGMKKGSTGVRLETLEKFALYFGCTVSDLISDQAEARSESWPFPRVSRALYDDLAPDDKIEVQGVLFRTLIDIRDRNAGLGVAQRDFEGDRRATERTRPETERPTTAHRRLLDSLPQRLGAPFQGDFHDADRRKKGEGR